MFATPEDLLRYIQDERIAYVDIRFCDLPGAMQHFNIPARTFTAQTFVNGLPFDGSSIRGFQAIHESDMVLMPDHTTAYLDPFRSRKTLALNCFIHHPGGGGPYHRDPRHVARKAEEYLATSGVADRAYFGAEAEFYVFDSVRHDTATNHAFYFIDSATGWWNSGKDDPDNRGYQVPVRGGYFPVPPVDHYAELRDEIADRLTEAGLTIERTHHEVGTGGQAEISYRYSTLLHAGDQLQLFKYIVKNTAWQAGRSATFMPKPLFEENGSGMHTNMSLWRDGEPLFYDPDGYAQLSDVARWYIGGVLQHGPSVLAFSNPTVNSYRRLVPGYEAPVNLVYSACNRSACMRIPATDANGKRVEFRAPDASGNPYLAFAAMLLAGLDGVNNKIEPPEPVEGNIYELSREESSGIRQLPGSLAEALTALEADHDYLTADGVFTDDLITTWLEYKRLNEVDPVRLRPTPHEFALYYDA